MLVRSVLIETRPSSSRSTANSFVVKYCFGFFRAMFLTAVGYDSS